MSDFEKAYQKTNGNEGGYAFNPNDSGGETYRGIARVFHPKWSGWKLIDGFKAGMVKMPDYGNGSYREWVKYLNKLLAQSVQVQAQVKAFYLSGFWNANRIGEIVDQDVAEWAYDHIVNAGARGAMWLQLAANVKPDGGIGAKTIEAVNSADPSVMLARAKDIAGAYRLDRAHDKPSQIQFLTSWLRRDGQPEEIVQMVKLAAADGKLDDSEVAKLKQIMETTA